MRLLSCENIKLFRHLENYLDLFKYEDGDYLLRITDGTSILAKGGLFISYNPRFFNPSISPWASFSVYRITYPEKIRDRRATFLKSVIAGVIHDGSEISICDVPDWAPYSDLVYNRERAELNSPLLGDPTTKIYYVSKKKVAEDKEEIKKFIQKWLKTGRL